jgi:lysophospholipid acyltransferase (LPLAT)-like uncharacterized protein
MKITHPLLTKSLGLFGATVIRAWTSTLDYRIIYHDPLVDPVHPRHQRRGIYVLWHEYLICPLGVRGKGMTVLISRHRDGELITQVMRHLRFQTVRGSSARGGVHALRKMLRRPTKDKGQGVLNDEGGMMNDEHEENRRGRSSFCIHHSSLIVTPDGPRGPRRHLSEGAIFLASRLQMPIVCMGFAFDRPWRQNSWDHFAIPRPFSRARAVISSFVEIPPNLKLGTPKNQEPNSNKLTRLECGSRSLVLGSSDLEFWRLKVEQLLNHVTTEAESWADSGKRRPGEMPLLRHQPAPQMFRPAA